MSYFFSFLKSKAFRIQLGLAAIALIVLCFLMLKWLKQTTHHGDLITVPNFSKMSVMQMRKAVEKAGLRYQVLDSLDYNPKYPRFSIAQQTPAAGSKVKTNRKIYLSVNPSGYKKVTVPRIIQVTQRNATAMLRALGLEVQGVTYINALGKNMVYRIKHKGKHIQPGDKLPKTSKIELICGNGTVPTSSAAQVDTP